MKAMILAAGKGERMMPLTAAIPKPLVEAGGRALIEHHVDALVEAGITDIVINTGRFGRLIEDRLGDGKKWNSRIAYSHEGEQPKGTGGGVLHALSLLGDLPFILVNGDIWTDYKFSNLSCSPDCLVYLVMVKNPEHNSRGDFCLHEGAVTLDQGERLTYSGIGIYNPSFFSMTGGAVFSYIPALRQAISEGRVAGEYYGGAWFDIGTPERLQALHSYLCK